MAVTHLKSLQALELAMRTRSLKAAADLLAISPAAVGQRVKALEDYLGLELVVRGRTGLQPTAALAAALPHLSAAFRELEAAAAALDLQRAQEIHIAATPDFADLWLKPRLEAFRAGHPNIRFCVNGEGDAPMRLGAADCEIDFRPAGEAGELLFHDFVLPVSSPENTARIAPLPAAGRLEGFPLLHLDFYRDDPAVPDWPKWIAAASLVREAPQRGIRFLRISRVLDAVRANAGLTICGLALIAQELDDGRLSLPFPHSLGSWTSHAFKARFRAQPLVRPQVRRFRDWLLAESERTGEWLAGVAGEGPPSA
jgi:LysR family glycine cleavage system transcriptional activator